MTAVTISNRLSQTLKEQLFPELQKNYYLLSKHPMLRYMGMEINEANRGDGSGSSQPRVKEIEKVDAAYRFDIAHEDTPFGGGTYAQGISQALRPGKFQTFRSQGTVKFITQSFEIPAQVIHAARNNQLSLVDEVRQNAEGALHMIHHESNRMWVAGHVLGYVNGAVSGATTITVQSNTSATNEVRPTMHLQKGDVLLIGTQAEIESDTAETVTVSSVTSDTVFEATQNEELADEDMIVRADVWNDTDSVYRDYTSLADFIAVSGTVQNVDKAANAAFQSDVTTSVGTLAMSDINAMVNKTRDFSPDPGARFLMGNYKQWERYSALLTTAKSYDADKFAGNLAGGVMGLDYYSPDGSLPFFVDNMVPDGVIYLIDPNGFKYYKFREYGPAEDGLTINGQPGQRKSGYLDYEFPVWVGGELAQTIARASGKLTGITA